MPSINSGEMWAVNKIAEVAVRCGIKPTIADVWVEFHDDDSSTYCSLAMEDTGASNDDELKKVRQVWSLLGLDESGYRKISSPKELDEIIERALSLAPRARVK